MREARELTEAIRQTYPPERGALGVAAIGFELVDPAPARLT